jgi:hypothetical protein
VKIRVIYGPTEPALRASPSLRGCLSAEHLRGGQNVPEHIVEQVQYQKLLAIEKISIKLILNAISCELSDRKYTLYLYVR